MSRLQRVVAVMYTLAGVLHFLRARAYEATVPEYVPLSARDAVRWSGVAEIVGGVAVAVPPTRRFARWWLLGLLAAVFPANVEMAVAPERVAKRGVPVDRIPRWLLWARLPLQPLFMWWVWQATE